jgi:hypothetical protein
MFEFKRDVWRRVCRRKDAWVRLFGWTWSEGRVREEGTVELG